MTSGSVALAVVAASSASTTRRLVAQRGAASAFVRRARVMDTLLVEMYTSGPPG